MLIFSDTIISFRTCWPHRLFPALYWGLCPVSGHKCHMGEDILHCPLFQVSGLGPVLVLSGHSQPTGNCRRELETEIVGPLRLKSGNRGHGGPLTVIYLDKQGFCYSVSDTPEETEALQIGGRPLPKKEARQGGWPRLLPDEIMCLGFGWT